ncbi:MAG: diaminopimelate epimerase [Chitinispirillaceae bacterium]
MKKNIPFVKMEGLGNDFVVLHEIEDSLVDNLGQHSIEICDRRRGVGADGVICVLPSQKADFRMRIFNSDGSEAEMCGNGVRCFAHYLHHNGLSSKTSISVDTLAGMIGVQKENDLYKVNMGLPRLSSEEIPVESSSPEFIMQEVQVSDKVFNVTAVSMGNPHAVIYADELSDELVFTYGPLLEKHFLFPRRTNVEFIKVISKDQIQMRVYERGCGETQACGTGACGAAVSGIVNGLHGNDVTVHLPGGDLRVFWDGNRSHPVYMTGPARTVFRGKLEIRS